MANLKIHTPQQIMDNKKNPNPLKKNPNTTTSKNICTLHPKAASSLRVIIKVPGSGSSKFRLAIRVVADRVSHRVFRRVSERVACAPIDLRGVRSQIRAAGSVARARGASGG